MEAEFLFKSQFDKSLKLLVGGIIFAFSIQPLFLASCPRALLPPEAEWVYKIPKTVPDLIRFYGYPLEEHSVETEDGYILTLHRIPYHNRKSSMSAHKYPVLLGHCLTGSSALWAYGPEDNSLSYRLAQAGYDVWMFNMRGNHYSRQHKSLNPDTDQDFWSFTFDESARMDYPAAIDYILNITSHSKLQYVGYSMGSTQYPILLSEVPEYNDKISAGHLLGPPIFWQDRSDYFLKDYPEVIKSIYVTLADWAPWKEAFSRQYVEMMYHGCTLCELNFQMCLNTWSLFGVDKRDPQIEFLHMLNQPGGASVRTILHYIQLIYGDGSFRKYDHGPELNLLKYGSEIPPNYELSSITAPTKIYAGLGDTYAHINDVQKFNDALPNSLGIYVVDDPTWDHYDFSASPRAGEMILTPLIKEIDRVRISEESEMLTN